MRREVWRLYVREEECKGHARRRVHIRATLQDHMIEHKWMAYNGIQGPKETCGCARGDAHSATATHDLCHSMASRILRTRIERGCDLLDEDLP